MTDIALSLRALQLYTHMAHHLCGRVAFFADHEFLGEIYGAAESDFDNVMERIIGSHGEEAYPALNEQLKTIFPKIANLPCKDVKENAVYFQEILKMEQEIYTKIDQLCKSPEITEGTRQLLGDIANRIETEQYKLKQRLKR